VGSYSGATGGPHGFLYSGGSFTPIDVPGSTDTFANGINASGQIVGRYDPVSVPEPSSLLFLDIALVGFVGLAAWRWKHAA
jgi:hypothetical protein